MKPPPFGKGVGWIIRDKSSLALRPRMIWACEIKM